MKVSLQPLVLAGISLAAIAVELCPNIIVTMINLRARSDALKRRAGMEGHIQQP